MTELDVKFLITLVRVRLVLWDKFLDSYIDRNATKKKKNVWREMTIELIPEYNR